MKASGAFSTVLLITSLLFSGGVKSSVSCGRWIDPAAASDKPAAPAIRVAPTAPAADVHDASWVADQYTVLGFI